MTKLSRRVVIGLFALQKLAQAERPVSRKGISSAGRMTAVAVDDVLRGLRRATLVRAVPGRGFTLARAAGLISVLDVVQALQPACAPEGPCGGNYDACPSRGCCVLSPLCGDADHAFKETLKNHTIDDLRKTVLTLPNCADPAFLFANRPG